MSLPKVVSVNKIVNVSKMVSVRKIANIPKMVSVAEVVNVPKMVSVRKIVNMPKMMSVPEVVNVPEDPGSFELPSSEHVHFANILCITKPIYCLPIYTYIMPSFYTGTVFYIK